MSIAFVFTEVQCHIAFYFKISANTIHNTTKQVIIYSILRRKHITDWPFASKQQTFHPFNTGYNISSAINFTYNVHFCNPNNVASFYKSRYWISNTICIFFKPSHFCLPQVPCTTLHLATTALWFYHMNILRPNRWQISVIFPSIIHSLDRVFLSIISIISSSRFYTDSQRCPTDWM